MSTVFIDETIRSICNEINFQGGSTKNWKLLTEEELLYEAVVCIFSSQMIFEVAVAIVDRLAELKYLRIQQRFFDRNDYEASILAALSNPIAIRNSDGKIRYVRPRFKNRLASLLTKNMAEIHSHYGSLQQLLSASKSSKESRKSLIQLVHGFGPKQASLFLRRIGYCTDLAVLDTHVMDYLRLFHNCQMPTSKLGSLLFYEQIENQFRDIAIGFGHSIGCVDLATWITMRVAKREGYL